MNAMKEEDAAYRPARKRLRLPNFDYASPGAYFITVCTDQKRNLLSDVCRGGALLRPLGQMCQEQLLKMAAQYQIQMDNYVIMPNHVHLLLALRRAEQSPAPTISEFICAWKSVTTKLANIRNKTLGAHLWQRSFYDHVIRNDVDYREIWNYIDQNPLRWEQDRFYIP